MTSSGRKRWFRATGGLAGLLLAAPALAHVSDRGYVLLLPTGYYLFGGAVAVALSFAILAFTPPSPLDRLARLRSRALVLPADGRLLGSTISFLVLASLLAAGLGGSRDPLSNPLPLVFWTFVWIGMLLVQGVVGDLWRWLNPWYAPWRLATRLIGRGAEGGLFAYPRAAGRWPAFAAFGAFVWFELVYVAPADPEALATAMIAYWLYSLAGMIAFGFRAWCRNGEFLTLLFTIVAQMGIAVFRTTGKGGTLVRFRLPGAGLVLAPSLAASGTAFLLLTLSSISFDSLMRTFFWLGLSGINPLEFPGRSAVVMPNSLGAAGAFLLLWLLFVLCVRLGEWLAESRQGGADAAGRLVWSLMPIVLGYHYSHHLPALLVDGQYALAAISDPFARGWNLFGTAGLYVSAAVTAGAEMAWVMWNIQSAAIISGHLLAVAASHVVAWRMHGSTARAARSQIPLAILMVAYTVFGLWLLSTPTGY